MHHQQARRSSSWTIRWLSGGRRRSQSLLCAPGLSALRGPPQGGARGPARGRSAPLAVAVLSPGSWTDASEDRLGGKPGVGRDGGQQKRLHAR
eukprot:7773739-Pyramimonas_sp.AAC.1